MKWRCFAAFLISFLHLSAADLAVIRPAFRTSEAGAPISNPVFHAGELVYFEFQIEGFGTTKEEKALELNYSIQTIDPSGRTLAEAATGTVKAELAPEDKDWHPRVNYEVQVPPVPEPGTYTIRITIDDRITASTITAAPTFKVESEAVGASAGIDVTRVRFRHSESDITGTQEGAVYKPGSPLFVSFDIVGFQFGAKNKHDVQYGIELRDPSGKAVFTTEKAASDAGEGSYPKLRVPSDLRLNLGRELTAGTYQLAIRLTDRIANNKVERTFPFQVEP